MKLWDKGKKTNKFVSEFTVGNDYLLDEQLVGFDALASIAHAKTLEKAKILSKKETLKLQKELKKIFLLANAGKFIVLQEQEDCHTAVENHLTKKLGELGKKIHAGRSRNDQAIAMLQLFSKKELFETELAVLSLCEQLLFFAKQNEFVPMPGYSHLQKAMPSSVGLWTASFAECLLDSVKAIDFALALNDASALGSAAGFGSALNLDRKFTAKLLGFSSVQKNVLSVQNSRGKKDAATIFALSQIMLDLNKLANDLILFSSQEFGFFVLPSEICTGSSIMPQKQNPDVLELVRAKAKKVQAMLFQVMAISASVGSGYSRDLQLTKEPLLVSFKETKDCLQVMLLVFEKLKTNKENCLAACSKEIFAADTALDLVKKGVSFRTAYQKVAANLSALKEQDVVANIKSKKLLGATGNLGLDETKKLVSQLKKATEKQLFVFNNCLSGLL